MAVECGNLIYCAERAQHHTNWTAFSPPLSPAGKLRVESIEDSLVKIVRRLARINEAANSGDINAVRAVLNEEFQFGKNR